MYVVEEARWRRTRDRVGQLYRDWESASPLERDHVDVKSIFGRVSS